MHTIHNLRIYNRFAALYCTSHHQQTLSGIGASSRHLSPRDCAQIGMAFLLVVIGRFMFVPGPVPALSYLHPPPISEKISITLRQLLLRPRRTQCVDSCVHPARQTLSSPYLGETDIFKVGTQRYLPARHCAHSSTRTTNPQLYDQTHIRQQVAELEWNMESWLQCGRSQGGGIVDSCVMDSRLSKSKSPLDCLADGMSLLPATSDL